jgi:hypothetical protein
MCGRAAQTLSAVPTAVTTFRVVGNSNTVNNEHHRDMNDDTNQSSTNSNSTTNGITKKDSIQNEGNYNMSPPLYFGSKQKHFANSLQ